VLLSLWFMWLWEGSGGWAVCLWAGQEWDEFWWGEQQALNSKLVVREPVKDTTNNQFSLFSSVDSSSGAGEYWWECGRMWWGCSSGSNINGEVWQQRCKSHFALLPRNIGDDEPKMKVAQSNFQQNTQFCRILMGIQNLMTYWKSRQMVVLTCLVVQLG
jgi:hypothetical protein